MTKSKVEETLVLCDALANRSPEIVIDSINKLCSKSYIKFVISDSIIHNFVGCFLQGRSFEHVGWDAFINVIDSFNASKNGGYPPFFEESEFSDITGKTIAHIIDRRDDKRDDELIFITEEYEIYRMYHQQDCCENVYIEDICGDLGDIIGGKILLSEEVTNEGEKSQLGDTSTWTFYKISTNKGSVTIRWYGTSNGYYSESVSFSLIFKA